MNLSQEGANALNLFFPERRFSATYCDEDVVYEEEEHEDPAQNLVNRFDDVADDVTDEEEEHEDPTQNLGNRFNDVADDVTDDEEESCSELV